MKSIEELNSEICGDIIADSEARQKHEMEKKIMEENLEIKKDSELAETNMSQDDSETQETIDNIITQDEVKDNADEMYDPFGVIYEEKEIDNKVNSGELTDLQKSFQRTELSYEMGKLLEAEVQGSKLRKIAEKNMNVIDLKLKVFLDQITFKEESIPFFFNKNQYCVDTSIKKLKELTGLFGFELKQEHCYSFNTIIDALEHLRGTWIKVKPTTRIEKIPGQPDKEYVNFEIVEVLGKNYNFGGNL